MVDRQFHLITDPPSQVTFVGDSSLELTANLKLTNHSDSRQAFKVKCSRNDMFSIRPPRGILDFNASTDIQIKYKPNGSPPDSGRHHIGVYHIPAPEGSTPAGAWGEHYGPPQGERRLNIMFERE